MEAYKSTRFESARKKIAKAIYQRYVSLDPDPATTALFQQPDFKKLSVFQLMQQKKWPGLNGTGEEKVEGEPRQELTVVSTNLLPSQMSAVSAGGGGSAVPGERLPTQTQTAQTNNALGTFSDTKQTLLAAEKTMLQMGGHNNSIGVYGPSVRRVKEKVERGEGGALSTRCCFSELVPIARIVFRCLAAPRDLFDEVAREVMNDLKLDVFPRFLQSEFYKTVQNFPALSLLV